MDKNILVQYCDMKKEIKDIRARIRKLDKFLENPPVVSDTVRGSRKDGTIAPIKVTGIPQPAYARSGVDILLHRYGRLKMSRAVVLQAASAAMLETYCDWKNEALRQEYQEMGWYMRPRFSPGYGDFPLECQKEIGAALEMSKRIGVTLTDSLLMAPSKSVTAVMGLSRKPRICSVQGCEACGKEDCAYRR